MSEKSILKNKEMFLLIYFFILFKLAILLLSKIYTHEIFGGGNDSNYYHLVAIGLDNLDNHAVNFWPIILRFLNNFGLYDRFYVSLFLSFLALFIIPFMVGKLSIQKDFSNKQYIVLFLFLIISIYPNIFFQSLDIYRDVFMIFIFLLGLFVIKYMQNSKKIPKKIIYFILALAISYVLYLLRPYLGFAFFVAVLLTPLYNFRKYPFLLTILALLILLQIASIIGLLDPILKYRTIFENMADGSNLGISFDNSSLFIPKFIQSFLYQIFGLYFINIASIITFLSETIPFLMALVYLIKNRKYSNTFVDFLIVFFVAYGTIWLLGNDNLGTATRLRIFNYIAIYIACFIVYQNKYLFFKGAKNI